MRNIDLTTYLNHIRKAVALISPAGKFIIKNSVFETLFTRGHQTKNDNAFELFAGEDLVVDTIKKVAEIRGSYHLRQVTLQLAKDQHSMDVEAFPVINTAGELLAIHISFDDHAGEAHFTEHQKSLDRIRYLGTIAAGLAHEIKNPLSGIKGATQLLASSLKNEKDLQEYATIIQKEVERVDQLLIELLHFTKPRSRNKKETNINKALRDIVLLQKTVDPKKIKFVEEYDPSLPCIMADSQALAQVFLNLLKNARQAIRGVGTITVRSHMVTDYVLKKGAERRQLIAVDIQDTGIGIGKEEINKIFVPFFTTKAKGTGLGLALCNKIIEEHEGNIKIKSEPEMGTTFSVYLPV